jgi:CheY-like chemotaxis protein
MLALARNKDGRRTLSVTKTRAGAGQMEAVEFAVGAHGAEFVREIQPPPLAAEPAPEAAERPAPRAEPPRAAPAPVPAPPEPVASIPPTPAREKPVGPSKILVVDEEEAALAWLRAQLEERYQVVTAADGFEALTTLLAEKPDLVILEFGLSRVTGLEVLSALHRAAEALPILMLIDRIDRMGQRLGPLALGAADVLAKPLQPFELLHKVEMLLRLEGPPPRLLEPEQAQDLFGTCSKTRSMPAAEFRSRLDRVCDFGARFAIPSTLLALAAPSAEVLDRLVGAADRQLRFEDSVLLVSKRRAVALLVAAELEHAPAVVERLARNLAAAGGRPPVLHWHACQAKPAGEIGDWRTLFAELEELETDPPSGDPS